ncbi:hypothetical protein B0H67DRAFT_94930 [Lasiosphaeris hirsuta]|uniref:Uncharacterized protein n=1 Tax=Lasiosphaeris hirsuta TaxID=260670 RepID=A0AA40BDF6_9PEZI|nr:hypothetical protein B0H67DRAFT_94930 [Lasiosphaeris hirsuta]
MLPALLRLALAALAPRLAAAVSAPISSDAVTFITNSAWDAAFLTANATGQAPVAGFNLSTPYPGAAGQSERWTWSIRVKNDVPNGNGRFVTGTWIQLDAPDGLLQPAVGGNGSSAVDPSWYVCDTLYFVDGLASDAAGGVDPGCDGVLPAACRADLLRSMATGFGGAGRGFRCPEVDLAPSCEEAFGKGWYAVTSSEFCPGDSSEETGVDGGLAIDRDREPEPSSSGTFDFARIGLSEDEHEAGNLTAYDKSIRQVYIAGLVWGYSNVSSPGDGSTPEASLSCLRVNRFTEGSRELSAGVSVLSGGGSLGLAMLAAGVVSVWLC